MHFKTGNGNQENGQEENTEANTQNQKSLCTQEKLALSSWDLPEKVLQHYTKKGITHMFPWQLECLTIGKVLEGGNLVYSAPTSAGKTLVAEILMAQTIFEHHKKVIFILPFVSVVREKMFYFQNMFSLNGIKVEGYMGGHSPSAGFHQVHMAVCTIEKANSIMNMLLEAQNLNSLGLVVVDEIHLLGDPYRGYLLELLLTKVKYMSSKLSVSIQIVGMSATLPNLKVIADWLKADLYYSSYRPTPLSEMLKCGNFLYDKKLNKLREIIPLQSEIPDLPDNIGQLCLETIKNGHSILIFCPSKAWCENLADEIALFFRNHGCSKNAVIENTPGYILRCQLNLEKISQVIEHLKMTPVGLDTDLHKTILFGVAFHHAGLTLDERDIIEGSFRNGSIRVLCATSTLSSGVNLPARRVIIRSPMAFGHVMDILTYRQMTGRAGRMGVDSEGESIIICKPHEKLICQKLMTSNLKPIVSCLGHGTLSSSLKRALLEVVVSGVASTPEEVHEYANCTFLASSSKHNLENPIQSCMKFLEENEFIRFQENGTVYSATPLGQACLASSMPPDEGMSLFRELQRARRCFVLDTDLHIIYQVTPYSVSEQWNKLDWLHVLNILETLPESMKRVGELVGIEEPFLVRIAKGTLNPNSEENRMKLSIHRRFYTALALQDLVNEVPLTVVAEKYLCNKGTLQSLQQSAATYAGMVAEFTRRLGWGSIELIFSQFQERLQFGVQKDLCELMRLPLLNVLRARALYDKGYTNLVALANASASDLENILYSVIPFQSTKEIIGETSFERAERNKLQTIWITGKEDLSVKRAAEVIIEEAQNILEMEIGVKGAKWGDQSDTPNDSTNKSVNTSVNEVALKEGATEAMVHKSQQATEHTASFICSMKSKQSSEKSLQVRECEEYKNSTVSNSWISKFCESFYPAISKKCNRELSETIKNQDPGTSFTEGFIKLPGTFANGSHKVLKPKSLAAEIMDDSNELDATLKCGTSKLIITNNTTDSQINKCHISEEVDKVSDPCNIKRIYESDCESACSEGSVEVLYETPADVKPPKGEIVSGDMFINQEADTEIIFKAECSMFVEPNYDLFNQSLTFDTQLLEILDVDDAAVSKPKENITKRTTSFNSDDLGFVSDSSPPKKITNMQPNSSEHDLSGGSSFIQILQNDVPILTSSPLNTSLKDISILPLSVGQSAKRKTCISDSPDFIIGSDDSLVENKHVNKKAKVSLSINEMNKLKSISTNRESEILQLGHSDDEIIATPKLSKLSLGSKNSNKINSISFLSKRRQLPHCKKMSVSDGHSPFGRLFASNEESAKKQNRESKVDIVSVKNSFSVDSPYGLKNNISSFNGLNSTKNWMKINPIDVTASKEMFQSFCKELKLRSIIGIAFGCRRGAKERRSSIGLKILKKKIGKPKSAASIFQFKDLILEGLAIYFRGNDVFYILFDEESTNVTKEEYLSFFREICSQNKVLRMFDAKEQIKLFLNFTSIFLEGFHQDPKTASWLLAKSWKEKNFTALVTDFIPEATKLTSQIGPLLGFSGPGVDSKSSVPPKTRACLEAFLTYHVVERQLKLLQAKSLLKLFEEVEMPLISCLAEMESVGFRFDLQKLIEIKQKLDLDHSMLSDKAYSFAQYKFNLSSSAAVSKVLYSDLKLGENDTTLTKRKRRPSTNKESLQELAVETNHPLPDIIIQWRKIQSILAKVISPLLQVDPDSSRIYSVTQLYTATGRLGIHEPNLQNIPRNFSLNLAEMESTIRVRDAFIPSENCLLLSVDYCQIELRLLAHLSGDENLIECINSSVDVFAKIASDIYGVSESNVNEELRQKAKQTCYGIIYGIGPRALSHQLRVEEQTALELMEDFKNKYKGVHEYLESTVKACTNKGYITSLCGRRRYLPCITDSNPFIKSEAERQAVNTAIQGSAADILKIAMIKIRQRLKDLKEEKIIANLLLHLHDELLFEVHEDNIETVAAVLKDTMVNAVQLKVPTPVKLHVGPTWGQLRLLEV